MWEKYLRLTSWNAQFEKHSKESLPLERELENKLATFANIFINLIWHTLLLINSSIIKVVLAVEVVGVDFLVIHTFNLNGRVEKVVFAAAEICHRSKGLQRLAALNVHGHWDFSHRKRPHVQVVNVSHVRLVLFPDVLLKLGAVNLFGNALHHHIDAAL